MNKKFIVWYIIIFIFGIIVFYLSWIFWIIEFILSLTVYCLIFYFFHFLWIKIRKKNLILFKDFINIFIYKISLFLTIITIIIWLISYLLNEIYPAPMPEYTISNWEKIVKFQGMSHIWTENFYNQVAENLKIFKKEWWVYFFEWVKPWSKENWEKFNKALWIQFDDDLYKNFSKLYWVSHQDNTKFFWLINDLDFNVDLNMDEIVKLYEERMNSKPEWKKEYKNKIPIDANKTIIETLSRLNDKQLKILIYINQAILNFIIWNENTQSFLTNNLTNKDLFEVILWKRNEVLANEIINSEYEKIYITYWLLHFKWVFELLKQNNKKWEIISIKNLYPIK